MQNNDNGYVSLRKQVEQKKTLNQQMIEYNNYITQMQARQAEIEKQQKLKEEEEQRRQNANFFERALATVGDFVGQIGVGISKGIEGIVDFGSGIVGAVGGLFDKNFQEQIKKNIAYDWTYNNIQAPLADLTKMSYINDASSGVQNIIRGVPQTIGQILPAVATGPASLGTLMGSAAGNGAEEAFKDGADYYSGLAYGSVTGAVEGAIEKISGGMAKNVFGKGFLDDIGAKIAGNAYAKKGVKHLLDAGGEALEEYVSTAINPYIKRMTYDPDAELSTQSERMESALIGGLASVGYRNTVGKIGEKKRETLENLQKVQETEQLANQEWSKGKLTDSKNEKYNQRISQAYQNASEQLRSMKPEKRAKFLEKYNLNRVFDNNGNYIGQNMQKVGVNLNDNAVVNNLSQDAKNAQFSKETSAQSVVDTIGKKATTTEAQFSIKKDANGKEYVNIDTDQHLFDGKNVADGAKVAKQYILEHFKGNNYSNIDVTKKAAMKIPYSGTQNKQIRNVRNHISTELDNLIKTGEFIGHKEDTKNHSFAGNGFDYYKINFKMNGNDYEAILNVGVSGDKKTLYDINSIQQKNRGAQSAPSNASDRIIGQSSAGTSSIDTSIRNKNENVNENSQKSEKIEKESENLGKDTAKSAENSKKDAIVPQKDGTVAPKQDADKDSKTSEQAQSASKKYNRRAYSPRLWGKETKLALKPTTKNLNAEQIEALDWFSTMNVHRNFADVVFTDELGANQNGAYANGVIYISTKAKMPTKTALMHELTHFMEGSKEYNKYAQFILDDLTKDSSVLKRLNDISGNHWTVEDIVEAYSKQYGTVNPSAIVSEVVAIYTSEYMFTDNFRLQKLANQKKNIFQKIFNFIKSIGHYFKNKVGKSAQEKEVYKFLNKAQKLYQKALDNVGKPLDIKGAKYSLSDTQNGKDLIVMHNISEQKLLASMEIGGFAVPSIAITKDDAKFENFGAISLIFDKATIDPENTKNKVFSADVYSKRFPKVVTKFKENVANDVYNKFEASMKALNDINSPSMLEQYFEESSLAQAVDALSSENFVKLQYLKDKGEEFEPVYKMYKQDEFDTPISEMLVKKYPNIINNTQEADYDYVMETIMPDIAKVLKEVYLSKAEQPTLIEVLKKSYKNKAEKVEEDLSFYKVDNFIRKAKEYALKKGTTILDEKATNDKLNDLTRSEEKGIQKYVKDFISKYDDGAYFDNNKDPFDAYGNRRSFNQLHTQVTLENLVKYMSGAVQNQEGFNYGVGNIRSLLTTQFKSLEEIRAYKDRIIPEDKMEEFKEASNNAFDALCDKVHDDFTVAADMLVDMAKGNQSTESIKRIFAEYGQKEPPLETVSEIKQFFNMLKNYPTNYFEAKPQRAVSFDEVKAVIAPKGTDERIINYFKDKGAQVEYYDDVIARETKIKDLPQELKFSLNKNVDNDNTNGVNSNKGAEYGRERTTRLDEFSGGHRNSTRDNISRLGRIQSLQKENNTREKIGEDRQGLDKGENVINGRERTKSLGWSLDNRDKNRSGVAEIYESRKLALLHNQAETKENAREIGQRDIEEQEKVKDFVTRAIDANTLKRESTQRRDEIELIESVAKDVNLTPIFCETDYGTMAYRVYGGNIYLHKDVSPDEFGEILDIERPYKELSQEQKYVGMSEARLKKIKERFPNAMLTRMRIDDFLKASGNEAIRRKIYSETAPLNVEDLQNVDSDMFLEVDLLSGKVISHEGRHRATALQQAGYTHIDVAVIPTTKEPNILHNVYVQAQESDKTIVFKQLVPINNELVKDKFVTRPSDLKYSLTKGEHNKILANYTRPKVYNKKEIKKIIDEIIDDTLHINDYYGLVRAKDKDTVVTKLFEDINKLDGKELDKALNNVADNIIEVAKYYNMYEDMSEVNVQDYEAIKSYRNKLDLSGIKGEIQYRFDDNSKVVHLHWSAGQKGGVSIADAIAELRETGVIIRADNDADAFFEMLDIYNNLRDEINAKVEEYSTDKFANNEISQMKETMINDLKNKLATSGQKSKIENIKEYFTQRIDYYKNEMRKSYSYSRALVKFKTSYDRFKGLKNTPADELVVPIIEKLTNAMQKTMTYTGNINKNVREILRSEFSPIHKQLMELSEQTDNPYIEELAQIANAPSTQNLTAEELTALTNVFDNAIHICKNFDKVFWENKKQSETEIAQKSIDDLNFNSEFMPSDRKFIFDNLALNCTSPWAVFDAMSAYDKDGFMNKAYNEIVNCEIKKQTLLRDVDYLLKDLSQKNKKEMAKWSKPTIDFAGGKITPGQQITMVMMWERPQARQHMENGGVLVINEKYAEKDKFIRAQHDGAIRAKVTQQDIDALTNSLTETQKQYIKIAEKIFNEVTRNAKKETDIALRGVSNVTDDKYIPIEVVDDGLAKRLGSEFDDNATIFNRTKSVYSYGFNKATKANATNPIAIDDIARVIARHTEDMSAYYGYGVFINSFNRIMNKKTQDGTTIRAKLNDINANFVPYVQQLLKDIQGIGNGRDKVQKVLDTIRNYSYKATLGLNIKSWAMQLISIFSARGGGLSYGDLIAGMGAFLKRRGESLAELDKCNALAHARFRDGFNTDVGRIKAEKGVLGKVDNITDKLIAPMSILDKWCNGVIWEACKRKAGGNLEQASNLFNEVLIKTQANWNAAFRPQIMRSKNAIMKFTTIYYSEPAQLLTRLYASTVKYKALSKMKKSEKYRTNAEFAEKVDKQLAEAKKNLITQVTNVAGGMAISTMIAIAFKELLKTAGDDDDEEWQDRLLPEFSSQVLGMFPIIRDMYSALQGYDITNSAYTGLQNIVNAGNNVVDLGIMLASGKQYDSTDVNKIIRQTIFGLSQTFGIPVRNAEKYAKAIVDLVSPQTAYEWNSLFKSRSSYKYYKALENASGNDALQSTILKTMLKDRGVAVQSNSVRDEMLRLWNNGINAFPSQIAGSYTDKDGNKIELSQSQYNAIQSRYAKAGIEIEKMMSLRDYQKADDETRASAIKALYNYYYKNATSSITGDSLSKFGLFAQGVDPYKLAMYVSQISAIKKQYKTAKTNKTTQTLKQVIAKYIQNTSLTANQKYLLLVYCGYKSETATARMKSYINSLNLTKEQKTALYTYCDCNN